LIQPHHLPPDFFEKKPIKDGKIVAFKKEEIQKRQLKDALARAKGNQSMAAKILGVSRVTVWNRMKRLGLTYTRQLGPE
jgi:two-component system response regulator HydG